MKSSAKSLWLVEGALTRHVFARMWGGLDEEADDVYDYYVLHDLLVERVLSTQSTVL